MHRDRHVNRGGTAIIDAPRFDTIRPIIAAAVCLAALLPALAAEGEPAPAPEPAPRIHWLPWSDETFAKAKSEDKPILVDIRAPWSRASLYMDQVIYADPDVVRLIGERWIPVSVDRDRRPDIDVRYQLAVFVVARGENGWPLTLFLQPDGQILFGGTFIPLEDRMQKAGMRSLLDKISALYGRHPEAAQGTLEVVKMGFNRTDSPHRPPEITPAVIEEVGRNLISSLNQEYGGFGNGARLPKPFALELAATLYHRTKDKALLDVLTTTLDGMERGAIHDRVAGGFHRMTSDPAWRIPEFEKLTTYNATTLESYLTGFQATGDPTYRITASRTVDYMLATLADPDGGFYVGQAAAGSGTEPVGLPYSWTGEEFAGAVPQGREKLAKMLFNVTKEGEIRLGDPPRNLLYLVMSRDEAARRLGMSVDAVREGEAAILEALAAVRARRAMPPVIKRGVRRRELPCRPLDAGRGTRARPRGCDTGGAEDGGSARRSHAGEGHAAAPGLSSTRPRGGPAAGARPCDARERGPRRV